MLNLPLALIGGVAGVYLAGGVLSVASIVGFITLFGIATRNGIMLVSHIRHLQEHEGVTDFRAAVTQGATERLAPILMTALAAGLALVPIAMSAGEARQRDSGADGDRDPVSGSRPRRCSTWSSCRCCMPALAGQSPWKSGDRRGRRPSLQRAPADAREIRTIARTTRPANAISAYRSDDERWCTGVPKSSILPQGL